jgi:hypothetical protein
MKVKDIQIGETYNGVKILEKFHEKGHTKYWCICPICGEKFSMKAETVGNACRCKKCNAKSRIIDLTGQRFGRLVAIEHAGRVVNKSGFRTTLWRCKCDCGKESIVRYPLLVSGNTRSCGCLERENKERMVKLAQRVNRKSVSKDFTGTLENHPLYKTWKSMLMRCNNPNVRGYKHYGGRGIKVCDRWSGDLGFENFINDMGERPTLDHTLDRIDVNGNYEPSNCRWATTEQQMNNRTDNSRILLNGESITCSQLCKRYGFYYTWVAHQLRAGIDINFIIKKQLRPKGERIGHAGRRAYSKDYGNHNRVVSDEVIKLLETNRK